MEIFAPQSETDISNLSNNMAIFDLSERAQAFPAIVGFSLLCLKGLQP